MPTHDISTGAAASGSDDQFEIKKGGLAQQIDPASSKFQANNPKITKILANSPFGDVSIRNIHLRSKGTSLEKIKADLIEYADAPLKTQGGATKLPASSPADIDEITQIQENFANLARSIGGTFNTLCTNSMLALKTVEGRRLFGELGKTIEDSLNDAIHTPGETIPAFTVNRLTSFLQKLKSIFSKFKTYNPETKQDAKTTFRSFAYIIAKLQISIAKIGLQEAIPAISEEILDEVGSIMSSDDTTEKSSSDDGEIQAGSQIEFMSPRTKSSKDGETSAHQILVKFLFDASTQLLNTEYGKFQVENIYKAGEADSLTSRTDIAFNIVNTFKTSMGIKFTVESIYLNEEQQRLKAEFLSTINSATDAYKGAFREIIKEGSTIELNILLQSIIPKISTKISKPIKAFTSENITRFFLSIRNIFGQIAKHPFSELKENPALVIELLPHLITELKRGIGNMGLTPVFSSTQKAAGAHSIDPK